MKKKKLLSLEVLSETELSKMKGGEAEAAGLTSRCWGNTSGCWGVNLTTVGVSCSNPPTTPGTSSPGTSTPS